MVTPLFITWHTETRWTSF